MQKYSLKTSRKPKNKIVHGPLKKLTNTNGQKALDFDLRIV